MNKHIQIRNVPESLHRRLKVKAARQGMTLSDYLRIEMARIAKLPTLKEWTEMVAKRKPVAVTTHEIVESIRLGREEHDTEMERRFERRGR